MAFTSSSLVALAVLVAGVDGAVLRRASPVADNRQVANLLNVKSLVGSVSQVRALQAGATLMEAVPKWATPMPNCVKAVNGTLTKLSHAYLEANVPTALHQACDDYDVYQDIGGDKETCRSLMAELTIEFQGERNYYTWCRSLTMASFKVIKEMKEMFESNATLKGLQSQCAKHCPYVAKMMQATAQQNMFLQKFMMGMMEKAGDDPEQYAKDMQEMLEMLLRQFNQLCDWRYKATCNSRNMHSSCSELMEATGLDLDTLEEIERECDSREGCRKKCHGVDANLVDYTLDQLKFFQELPLPSNALGSKQCAAIDALATCAKDESCETYLAKKVSPTADSASEYFESWKPTCDWFADSCSKKRETACKTQVAAFNKEWRNDLMCMIGDTLSEGCCNALQEVALCDQSTGCAEHLSTGIPLLDMGLEEAIPKQCQDLAKLKVLKFGLGTNTSLGANASTSF